MSRPLSLEERASGVHQIGGWVVARADVEVLEKIENPFPL